MGNLPFADDNQAIPEEILSCLSEFGHGIYFPKKGILGQSAEAKTCAINATIGIALEEDGTPMALDSVSTSVSLPSQQIVPYAPSYGLPDLRQYWQSRLLDANPSMNPNFISLPVVTCALTHALSVAGRLVLDTGDLLVMPDLFWGNYRLIFEKNLGAELSTFPTFDGDGFNVAGCLKHLRSLPREKDGERRRLALLLNFPNNPTGYSITRAEAVALRDGLAAIAAERGGLTVLVDDAYFGLRYEDNVFPESIFSLLSDASSQLLTIKIDGATKEDYVWGLRVGFLTFAYQGAEAKALEALENKCAGTVRATISNAPRLSQSVLLEAYGSDTFQAEKAEKYRILKDRFEHLKLQFSMQSGFEDRFDILPSNAGYFLCLRPLGVQSEPLRTQLINHYGVGVIAAGPLIRIAFSSVPKAHIASLVQAIVSAYDDLMSSTS